MSLPHDSDDHAERGVPIRPGAVTALIDQLVMAPSGEPPPVLGPGARVGRYEVIRILGRGGFGAVYEAHDGELNRLVALKVFHRSRAAGTEVAREGEAAALLAHPNIATVHDVGLHDGAPYLVYERLHGETLASRLGRGPLPAREALHVSVQVARALEHAHDAGVVHRDVKPANVFLCADGDVKVLDFGVALLFGRDGPAGGTPAYMAPEQRRGEPEDARTDLYALGLLLREMLTGARDDGGATDRIPPTARRILAALLAEDPVARPRSARAALRELEAAARALEAPRPHGFRVVLVALAALALVLGVAFAALHLWREPSRPGAASDAAPAPSIAVLPFVDLSPGKDQAYFAEGLAEEILNALSAVEGLRVAGRTSSFSFKDRNVTVAEIGRDLHVGAVLEGSVRKEGQRVRITAQVVSTADGYRLWSDRYDREIADVFAVQEEIARAVVAALSVKLVPGREPRVAPSRTTTVPEAYRRYLLGRHFFNAGTAEGFRRAAEELEQAIALDPGYAPAHAWLATALLNAALSQTAAGVSAPMQRALAAGERAVALGPDLAECYSARGWMRISVSWDWAGAQSDFERALALNPGDTSALVRRGALFAVMGRLPEAIAITRRATEVDPLYAFGWVFLATYYDGTGRPDLARGAVTRALEIAPEHAYALRELGYTHVLAGEPGRALAVFQRHPWASVRLAGVAIAQHDLGHLAEERKALDELRARFGDGEAYQIALVHAWRGEREAAFEWLERAFTQHNVRLRYLKFDPLLGKIRDDPRYASLVQRMNLPP